jgi:6-phosphofructokinase 1
MKKQIVVILAVALILMFAGCGAEAEKEDVLTGTVGIARKKAKKYAVKFEHRPISDAAKYTRSVPKEFIARNGHDVTQAFIDYAKPLVGDLPYCEVF